MKTILVALLLVSSSVFAQSYGGEWQQRQLQQQQWQQYNQVDPYRQNMQQRRTSESAKPTAARATVIPGRAD